MEEGLKINPEFAYTLPLPQGVKLKVSHSANAWWMNQSKIDDLVHAFRVGCTIPEACAAAGITVRQYKYFVSLHPEFSEARKLYVLTPRIIAKFTIHKAIENGDAKLAWKWLIKNRPEEFGPPSRRRRRMMAASSQPKLEQDPEIVKIMDQFHKEIEDHLKSRPKK